MVGRSVGPACTIVASRRGEVAAVGEEEMRVAGWPTRKPMARVSPAASKATLRRLIHDGTILLLCKVVWGRVWGVGMTHTMVFRLRPPASFAVVVEWRKEHMKRGQAEDPKLGKGRVLVAVLVVVPVVVCRGAKERLSKTMAPSKTRTRTSVSADEMMMRGGPLLGA